MTDIEGFDIAFWEVMIRSNDNKSLIYVADFEKVRLQSKIRFMYWKLVQGSRFRPEGGFPDPACELIERDTRNWVPRGGYQFFVGDQNGKLQAMYYLEKKSKFKMNLPDIVDAEFNSTASYKQTANELELNIRTMRDQTGRYPLIYTADWYWRYMPLRDIFSECELYVSNPTRAALPFLPRNGPWKKARIWQDSFVYKVPGLVGGTDHDRFMGDEIEFQSFIVDWNPPPPDEFPKKAVCIVRSLWIRSSPMGNGIGGLKLGDVVDVYELLIDGNGMTWARLSPDGEPSTKWTSMSRIQPNRMTYMRFI